jgi:hypothetical protein
VTDEELEPIFGSDLAQEVRREFDVRAVEHTMPVPAATRDVLVHFGDMLSDPNAGPVIFLALAALQYKAGRLMPFVRDAAIDLIQTGEARRAYGIADPNLAVQRRKLLSAFEVALAEAEVVE